MVFVGVVLIKFFVKVVFDLNKFDGLYVVMFDKVQEMVDSLLLEKILGVGKVVLEKLY